ncbi:MAG TPA: amidohydrolase family protein [Terriglobales bacterium]|nr:amidohydrolase family protein [Terriglobales bacterium]
MKKTIIPIVLTAVSAAALLAGPQGGDAPRAILIKNATIMPVVGEKIDQGQLLIQDGKIAGLGKSLTAPEGALVIDAAGQFVYPGFIDAYSHFGLAEISAIPSTVDVREMGKENPEMRAVWAVNPASVHFGTSRVNGTTAALVAPSGGTFPGISALLRMDGWTVQEMAVSEAAASLINFPMTPRPAGGEGGGQQQESKVDVTSKLVDKIKDYLKEARRYLRLKKDAAADPKLSPPETNPKYEALAPVLDGRLPVIISVEKSKDIELAIKFVQEEKLKAIFRGCGQGFKVADKIKKSGIPVIVDSLYVGPSDPEDGYDAPWRNVSEMAKAGIMICFSSGDDPGAGKDLPYHAARAVAYGLSHEEALKALTINPAKVFGVDNRMGSLEVGKDADLFITTGDPLDPRSEVKHLFIAGRHTDMKNYWEDLYEKYKSRPIK